MIEARHRKVKAEAQQAYSMKLKNIQNNFNKSYERCLQQREEKSKLNEEKTLKKYSEEEIKTYIELAVEIIAVNFQHNCTKLIVKNYYMVAVPANRTA